MANQNDSFIDEVTDDLRRDRLFLLMRRYGWIAALAVVALVGFAGWREWSAAREAAGAQAFGDAVLAAENADAAAADPAARAAALAEVAAPRAGQAALRDVLAGNALIEAGDTAAAAARFDSAAQVTGDRALRDLARLKSVLAQGRDMDPAARDAALAELSAPGAPFELIALEFKAIALVGADRTDDAITLIRQIQQKSGLTQAQRRRLAELLITLGVDPEPDAAAQTAPDPTRAAEVVTPQTQN